MPTDYIRYDLLVQDALRSVVRKVLTEAARTGLPGDHHFNISFKTQASGVVIPASMRQRYPDEMAIILQHEFWDLEVTSDGFEVSLNFSRKPERLTIPFDSITGFSDPSVPFGFKLEPRVSSEAKATPALPGVRRGQASNRSAGREDAARRRRPRRRSLQPPRPRDREPSKRRKTPEKHRTRWATERRPKSCPSTPSGRNRRVRRRWAKSSICAAPESVRRARNQKPRPPTRRAKFGVAPAVEAGWSRRALTCGKTAGRAPAQIRRDRRVRQ